MSGAVFRRHGNQSDFDRAVAQMGDPRGGPLGDEFGEVEKAERAFCCCPEGCGGGDEAEELVDK